ncbi:RNA polymerase sigma factor [Mucilaginibacter paludis]|uniref:Sigma-70 family RNA polymerase sigma factor n=1 Tax=Mucilaginibacter paludis DSM 18603 TaxID=714943 RepID=H1Y2H5_9SPHI|nr:DNA-directed RNA polymerase sigma-70 factor [Mucilaginibacter paludis]EHQ28023.1 sigma-70 family RNA polymerase sigma factor [Mucilaginibacter paludis DSM 18603]
MAATLMIKTKEEREQVFIFLYKKAFPAVAKYVSKMGGSFDEAKDVFQDALVIYYEKVLTSAITFKSSEKAYLSGIAKHLWLKTYREGAKKLPLDAVNLDAITGDIEMDYASAKLMTYLQTAGQKCMDMLRAFYYDKLSAVQVTELFGYSGPHSTTVQKYKCLEKVRDTVKQKSLTYEDFLE